MSWWYPFPNHLSLEEVSNLETGDKIDYAANNGRVHKAKIVGQSEDALKIHFEGYKKHCDKWCEYKDKLYKFAKYESISNRTYWTLPQIRKYGERIGDFVDVNSRLHPGWRVGKIIKIYCGQMKIQYQVNNRSHFYWVHKDDKKSVDEYRKYTQQRLKEEIPIWLQIRDKMKRLRRYSISEELDTNLCKEIIDTLFPSENGLDEIINFVVNNGHIGQLQQIDEILDKYKRKTCSIQTKIENFFDVKLIKQMPASSHSKYKQLNIHKYFGGNDIDIQNKEIIDLNDVIINSNLWEIDHKQCILQNDIEERKIKPSLTKIPDDAIKCICSYLQISDIKSLHLTSYRNYKIGIQEMEKISVGVFNTNYVIDKQHIHYVNMKKFPAIFIKDRFLARNKYKHLFNIWEKRYNIPQKYQFLLSSLQSDKTMNQEQYDKLDDTKIGDMKHNEKHRSFYLFDKRNVITFKCDVDEPRTMNEYDKYDLNKYKFIILKWFDIFTKTLSVIQYLYVDKTDFNVDRLMYYIENEFISTTSYQTKWHQNISSFLKLMKAFKTNQSKFSVYKESMSTCLYHAKLISDPINSFHIQDNNAISTFICQFNISHKSLLTSHGIASLKDEYIITQNEQDQSDQEQQE